MSWGVTLPSKWTLYADRSSIALTIRLQIKYAHHDMALDPVAAWITSQEMATPTTPSAQNFGTKSSNPPAALHTHHTRRHALARTGTFTATSFATLNPSELWMAHHEALSANDRARLKKTIMRSRASKWVDQDASSVAKSEGDTHTAANTEWHTRAARAQVEPATRGPRGTWSDAMSPARTAE